MYGCFLLLLEPLTPNTFKSPNSVGERTHGYCLSILPITDLCGFMAMDQIFIKAKEEVREKLKQKDRMGAIKTQDRVGEPIS